MNQEVAEGHVCIFHPRLRALHSFTVQDTRLNQWFRYGLCPICSNRLKKQESFKQDINDRLEELVAKLQKQEEKKCKSNQQ